MTEALAAGKLVICGEYAVLEGAPAIAVAVPVCARARVSSAGSSRLVVAGDGAWSFAWDDQGIPRWLESPPSGQGRVLEAICAMLASEGLALSSGLEVSLDTRDFSHEDSGGGRQKLGLGSSAAITVALTAALLAHEGREAADRDRLLELACAAHRRLQGGQGSGIDVAAAVHGGVVALQAMDGKPRVQPLAWPQGVYWLAAWSGVGASTPDLLARFHRYRQERPEQSGRHMSRLAEAASLALSGWRNGDGRAVLGSLAGYQEALRGLDSDGAIGIWTAAHQRLADVATQAGALYKTSGAGGGDFGLAFSASAQVIDRLTAEYSALGVLTLTSPAMVAGVRVAA